ncbi:MAG TPA: tripartite tricarboxylate transporter substrate binding protein [Xanthobacteraceae bacterium]|nr:tripartite tricarboxylate transporter substrate binding protein [Xanthobacteraceae bacterium]
MPHAMRSHGLRRLFAVLLLAVLGGTLRVEAQTTYPSKVITIVVPAPPGGVTDILGRMLAQHFSTAWGQQAIVENRGGANNIIAAEYVAKAPPDGHTLLIGPEVTFVANPSLYQRLPYSIKDFTPVVGLVLINHGLITNPSLPVHSVSELIAYARAHPGELNYGTYGVGSTAHLNMELFARETGTKLVPVHYKGAAPAMTDVIAGHIQLMYVSAANAVQPAAAGQVRFLAVGADKRMRLLPDVPTVAEAGLPGYRAVSWFGLFAPAGTPRPVVDKINGEVRAFFADPQVAKNFLDRQLFEPIAGTPEDLSDYLSAETQKWSKVIRDAGIKGE